MQSILSTGKSRAERARRSAVSFQATGPPQPFLPGDPYKLAFTIKEAVRASGLSRSILYIAIGKGVLQARKCGARTLILDSDLRRFLRTLPRFIDRKTSIETAS
jgi:hypothetical protein